MSSNVHSADIENPGFTLQGKTEEQTEQLTIWHDGAKGRVLMPVQGMEPSMFVRARRFCFQQFGEGNISLFKQFLSCV